MNSKYDNDFNFSSASLLTDTSYSSNNLPGVASEFGGMTYYPTLFLGVGGTGAKVLRRVKQKLIDNKLLENKDGIVPLHKFLYIDTDSTAFLEEPELADVLHSEQVFIGPQYASILLSAKGRPKSIASRFPADLLSDANIALLSSGMGSAQIRGLGALAYTISYANEIKAKMQIALDGLRDSDDILHILSTSPEVSIGEHINVYIVGSLAGGTGSGCFIDVAMTVRSMLNAKSRIYGFFALAEGYATVCSDNPPQLKQLRANVYAALKELNYVQKITGPNARKLTLSYDYGEKSDSILLKEYEKLFYHIYLFDIDKTNSVALINDLESLYSIMTATIYQDIATPIGRIHTTILINQMMLNTTDYSTAQAVTFYIPTKRILEYCRLCSMAKYIGSLLNEHSDENEYEKYFLTSVFNDSVKNITKRLQKEIPINSVGIDFEAYVQLDRDNLVDKVHILLSKIDLYIQLFTEKVEDNTEDILKIGECARTTFSLKIHKLLKETVGSRCRGLASVDKLLDKFLIALKNKRESLLDEIDAWDRNIGYKGENVFYVKINALLLELTEMNFVEANFLSKDKKVKKEIVHLYNDLVHGILNTFIQRKTVLILTKYMLEVEEEKRAWSKLVNILRNIRLKSDSLITTMEHMKNSTTLNYDQGILIDVTCNQGILKINDLASGIYAREFYNANMVDITYLHRNAVQYISASEAESKDVAQEGQDLDFVEWLYSNGTQEESGAESISRAIFNSTETLFKEERITDIGSYLEKKIEERPRGFEDILGVIISNVLVSKIDADWEYLTNTIETIYIKCCFVLDEDQKSSPPEFVRKVVETFVRENSNIKPIYINSNNQFEIEISKRNHNCLINNLANLRNWKEQYSQLRRERAEGVFGRMLHTHSCYEEISDISIQ